MNNLLRQSKLFLSRNASTILTCIGGAGVIATSVMAVKATPKALILLKDAEEEKGEELTKLETIKVAGPAYIPAALVGISTITCIFGANALNKKQQAALTSAYALLENSYKTYRKKVTELYGEDADNLINAEIAKDKYEDEDIPSDDDGKLLFYDLFSDRYFRSTIENVQHAEYELNRSLVMRDCVALNEFYELLDIPKIDGGDAIGWSTGMNFEFYWQIWIDFDHEKVVMDDGLECYIIKMHGEPSVHFEEY